MIIKRLKNLWKLSNYEVQERTINDGVGGSFHQVELKKDRPTIQKRLAKIIQNPLDFIEDDPSEQSFAN